MLTLKKLSRIFLGLTMLISVMGYSQRATATIVWDLANDFSLAANPNGAWSYQLENDADDASPETFTPLDTNTRDANAMWGRSFATSPTMWSQATGFWGVGRNDTGVTQTSGTMNWAPGEILLHPKPGSPPDSFPARMVITWEAPADFSDVEVAYMYSSVTSGAEFGDGVGLSVLHESGGVFTLLDDFTNPGAGGEDKLIPSLAVSASDRLHFRFDNWAHAGGDVYRANITLTAIPEPNALALACLALLGIVGIVGFRRNKQN